MSWLAARSESSGLSWAASFAAADDSAFDSVLECASRFTSTTGDTRAELALTALAYRRPDRLLALAERLDPQWRLVAEKSLLVAEQLHERERGPLHPELELVWQQVAAEP